MPRTRFAVLDPVVKEAGSTAGTLYVKVEVLEERKKFGRLDCLVAPVNGGGQRWISDRKLIDRLPAPKRK